MEALSHRAAEFLFPLVTVAEVVAVIIYAGTIIFAILLWSRFPVDLSFFYLTRKILVAIQFLWVKAELGFSWLTKAPKIQYLWPVLLGILYVSLAYRLIPWAERRRHTRASEEK